MTYPQPVEPLGARDIIDLLRQQLDAACAEIARLTAELEQHRRRHAMAQEMLKRARRRITGRLERDPATIIH